MHGSCIRFYPVITGRELLALVAYARRRGYWASRSGSAARAMLVDLLRENSRDAAVLMSTHDAAFARSAGARTVSIDGATPGAPGPVSVACPSAVS